MKQCVLCGLVKGKELFYKDLNTKDKLNRYCIKCCKVNRALESVRKRDKKSKISMRQRHRAGVLGVNCDNSITLVQVFKTSLGVCTLCHRWVQPRRASIDHIIPLSKGGTHTWPNVQLVHLVCNLRKGNRT